MPGNISSTATYDHLRSQAARAAGVKRATIEALEWVLLPHRMNAYGGYDNGTDLTWYLIDDKDRGWYKHYIWNSRLTGGVATITHRKSAFKRKKSKVTSQRWARKMHRLGLVEKTNVPDPEHGGFGPNRYRAQDPSYPEGPRGDALAIVYSGKIKILTVQPIEIPPVPDKSVAPEKPKPGAPQRPNPEELPLPPAWNLMTAREEGLTDRLEIALLWAQHKARKEAGEQGKGKKLYNPNGYWRNTVRKRVKELEAQGKVVRPQQMALPLKPRSMEQERQDRQRFMLEQAALLLAQGFDPGRAVERIEQLVYPAGLCIHTGPSRQEAQEAVEAAKVPAEELRVEFERRRQRLTIGQAATDWLRATYAQLRNQGQLPQERQLFGDLTPTRAARTIASLPNRPSELQQASPEQIEKLLEAL